MLAEGNRVEIIVDHLPEELEQAAKDIGASVDREASRVSLSVDTVHKRALAEMLWAGGCDVLSLTPTKSSLEDMFLKLVGGSKE